jgi:hypothetical protein
MLTKVTKLSDKAMLVKLTIKRAALTKRDQFLTDKIQAQEGDQSLTVLTKLFRDKSSPINQIMTAVNEVYAYHRKHTLPYVDAGPRILPSDTYMDYTQEMKHLIAKVDNLLANYMPHYQDLVNEDVMYRNAGHAAGRATVDDYPSAEKFREAMSVEYRFSPMPDSRHFLFDLSDEDLAAFDAAEAEAAAAANADTVARMLKPLHSLVERLKEFQGTKGERFHNSLIQNVIEGCDLAKKLAINPTQELLNEINTLHDAAKACLADAEIIKGSANARASAKDKLEEVAKRMAAFA